MSTHLLLEVDLELDATPISGRISDGSELSRRFHGWLEFASAIETLRHAAREARQSWPAGGEPSVGHRSATRGRDGR